MLWTQSCSTVCESSKMKSCKWPYHYSMVTAIVLEMWPVVEPRVCWLRWRLTGNTGVLVMWSWLWLAILASTKAASMLGLTLFKFQLTSTKGCLSAILRKPSAPKRCSLSHQHLSTPMEWWITFNKLAKSAISTEFLCMWTRQSVGLFCPSLKNLGRTSLPLGTSECKESPA